MYCQKCRSPLKLDKSLEHLNPTAFDLLVDSTGKALQERTVQEHFNLPQERKELYERVSGQSLSPITKRNLPAPRDGGQTKTSHPDQRGLPDMSFIEITQSQIVPADENPRKGHSPLLSATEEKDTVNGEKSGETKHMSPSWEFRRNERLFSILSSHSDIDHPVCAECTSLLLNSFHSRLAASTKERDAYISFLKSLQSIGVDELNHDEVLTTENELKQTMEKEMAALTTLEQLEEEKRILEEELAKLEEESRLLEVGEQEFWASRNFLNDEFHDLITNLANLQQKHSQDQQQLERLQRTNVYNDAFCIGHDGQFVTINGLRLGRLPNHNVEWPEINAALGQTLLLLSTIAERVGFAFRGYRLRPLGSTSRIEKVEWPQQAPSPRTLDTSLLPGRRQLNATPNSTPKITLLDLFSSGDIPFGRVFSYQKFDTAMGAFLECLSQLGEHVEKSSSSVSADRRPGVVRTPSPRATPTRNRILPYFINGDKIGDPATGQSVSIKLGAGFQPDESWTRACKYALTCCKYLLAYVSNLTNVKEGKV